MKKTLKTLVALLLVVAAAIGLTPAAGAAGLPAPDTAASGDKSWVDLGSWGQDSDSEDMDSRDDDKSDDYDPGATWNFTGADEDANQLDEELPLTAEFSDVKSTAWYYNDVMECAKLGIVQGFEDGSFKPEDKVTGIQFIVMMTRTFYNDKVEQAKKTETSSWYAPNMKVANDVTMLKFGGTYTLTPNDKAMSRYDMAHVLACVLNNNGKLASLKERNTAKASIKDAGSIPSDRSFQVYTAYHFGVITGMTDGTFSGTQSMTRTQACTVIMRMMKLLNNYNPGDKDNDQYDDGKSQNETTAVGKLTNGKDATTANVRALLKEIERKYPTGTTWGKSGTANNNWYSAPATNKTRDVVALNSKVDPGLSLAYACGGWMAMVSETIFGLNGAPAREVYSIKDARPGDIAYKYINGKVSHVSIITSVTKNTDDGTWRMSCCDGNIDGKVSWSWDNEYGFGSNGLTNSAGNVSYRIFTRYPQ